jgi:tetratricopeptide (TPR) repeat protein
MIVCLLAAALGAEEFDILASRAVTALDTGRLDLAEEIFAEALAADGERAGELSLDRAWVHVRRAERLYRYDEYCKADESLAKAVQIAPELAEVLRDFRVTARWGVFWEEKEIADQKGARYDWSPLVRYSRETLAVSPGAPAAHYLLAYALERKRDILEARREYTLAAGQSQPRGASISQYRHAAYDAIESPSFEWPVHPAFTVSEEGEFEVIERPPFRVFHHNRALAERVARALEYYLSEPVLDGLLPAGKPFPDVCDVYLHRNAKEYHEAAGSYDWARGIASLRYTGDGRTRGMILVPQDSAHMIGETLPHELAHIRFDSDERNNRMITVWIDEGIATSAEPDFSKAGERDRLRRARDKGTLIGVREILKLEYFPDHIKHGVVYSESLAMVDTLVGRYGVERFWRFIELIEKKPQTEALKEVYGLEPVDFEQLVLEWIRKTE